MLLHLFINGLMLLRLKGILLFHCCILHHCEHPHLTHFTGNNLLGHFQPGAVAQEVVTNVLVCFVEHICMDFHVCKRERGLEYAQVARYSANRFPTSSTH
jgi:hypothetical protein